jgi:hypothetical protein
MPISTRPRATPRPRSARARPSKELMEAIWIAAEMRAGAAYAHSNLALETMNELKAGHTASR